MSPATAGIICRAINRHLRRRRAFDGGRAFGVDYRTWCISYPHLSRAFSAAAGIVHPAARLSRGIVTHAEQNQRRVFVPADVL